MNDVVIGSPRKRKRRDPSNYKLNIVKEARIKGQSYVSHKGKEVPAKKPQFDCSVFVLFQRYVVKTDRCGDIVIHVQGDVSQQDKRAVFLTVHDLGCNRKLLSFEDFITSPVLSDIKERSIFIHVDVPGHEDNADPLPDSFQFPSSPAQPLGEGAGANVLARFGAGLYPPADTLGMILHSTALAAATTVKDNFKS
ncbi:uncharacterized protein ZK1073.1-like [Homalodisca vitripennis]|uniref:uncharacterized protein ZK1073.1-like n=1 Tax=Homalodisca vitripennis TaxID=197043 RepID=UPI001EEB8223|nr:uncharacterized protein ZK1073.1-like [Homalodisca vitripennis]